jgi:maleylacetoacetate isomerase
MEWIRIAARNRRALAMLRFADSTAEQQEMKLYGYYRSSASYRIRIVLNIKGIRWRNEPVSLIDNEQKSEHFHQINPAGLVPVLDTGNAMLAQSAAIAEFLEEQVPSPRLLPGDATARAQVREMMHTIGCDIHPLQNLRVLRYLRSEYSQDDEGTARWCRNWIANGFSAFENLASRRSADSRYSFGDSLTLADAWLIPQVYNARRFSLDLAPYPVISAIDRHCSSLQAFLDAAPDRQPDSPAG